MLAQRHQDDRQSRSWKEKFKEDAKYVDNVTFLTYVKILLGTIGTVVQSKGIDSGTSVTMEPFMGNGKTDKPSG